MLLATCLPPLSVVHSESQTPQQTVTSIITTLLDGDKKTVNVPVFS